MQARLNRKNKKKLSKLLQAKKSSQKTVAYATHASVMWIVVPIAHHTKPAKGSRHHHNFRTPIMLNRIKTTLTVLMDNAMSSNVTRTPSTVFGKSGSSR